MTGCEQLLFEKPLKIGFPKRLDPDLLAKVSGRFVDTRNRTLVVAPDGTFARALITWDAKRKTAGFLSSTGDGTMQFLFQNEPGLPVTMRTDETGRTKTLSMLKMDFHRAAGR